MTGVDGYRCTCCGQRHDGLPFAYGTSAPVYWNDELTHDGVSVLGEDQCEIKGEDFFVRARIILPVLDADEDFEWGVWVSLSRKNYARMSELWDDPRQVEEPPYFGWLSTHLPCYPESTVNLKTNLHHEPGRCPTAPRTGTHRPPSCRGAAHRYHTRPRAGDRRADPPSGRANALT